MLLLLFVGGVQTTTAQQDDIDWSEYASTVEVVMNNQNQYVYLYNLTKKGFLNTGGKYGMMALLNTRGIRLELERNSSTYAFKSPVVNSAQGSYLAAQNGNAPIYRQKQDARRRKRWCPRRRLWTYEFRERNRQYL